MPLKAGVVQFSPIYGRVNLNLERLKLLIEAGVRDGAELLVLPEMAWTGYLWRDGQTLGPLAETASNGPGQDLMAAMSRRWGVSLVYGFPEKSAGELFNSQGFATPDGSVHPVYRKTHLFEADEWWAKPGDTGYLQWTSPWGPVGSGVCMDLNFDDLPAFHSKAKTKILAFSTNWLDEGTDILPYWEARLEGSGNRGFQGAALFADRGGAEFGIGFRGQSAVFVGGKAIASFPGKDDGVLVVDLDL